ncbi:protein TIC [Forsythia ovata]|uniref:Protein TIC n=1 Tax=Forsythia ovata TaxID=205694 RepID=A0ABD1WVS4_9LAMI
MLAGIPSRLSSTHFRRHHYKISTIHASSSEQHSSSISNSSSSVSGLGGAVALGATEVGAAYALNSCVPEVAVANLHNGVVVGGASFIGNLVDLGDCLAVEIYNPNQYF